VTDFVGLCRAARSLPGPETHDRLWSAWFALPEWHFVAAPSPVGPLPFSNFIEGQRCVLAFTTAAGADGHARLMRVGPPMALAPEAAIQKVPQLKMYGVYGFLVDVGPDGFHTSVDKMWAMFHRFRAAPYAPTQVFVGPAPGTVEWFLGLAAWHVLMTTADRGMPELATQGTDLIAQVYSSPYAAGAQSPIVAMAPAHALSLFSDIELVRFVRFDNHLVVDLMDLRFR
jgi:hypothetical protein